MDDSEINQTVLSSGTVEYRNSKRLWHRIDGPTRIGFNNTQEWWVDGQLHRLDGPAVVRVDGSEEWYLNGKRHRDDGPASTYSNGTIEWWAGGKHHRTDGPAVTYADRTKYWCQNGKLHRVDGPAVIHANGQVEWWIEGEKQFKANIPGDCNKKYRELIYNSFHALNFDNIHTVDVTNMPFSQIESLVYTFNDWTKE
jgi:hypothetical protein